MHTYIHGRAFSARSSSAYTERDACGPIFHDANVGNSFLFAYVCMRMCMYVHAPTGLECGACGQKFCDANVGNFFLFEYVCICMYAYVYVCAYAYIY